MNTWWQAIKAHSKPWLVRNAFLLLGLIVLYLIVLRPFLIGKIYAEFDLREQFIPWRLYYKLSLERGELGLWNPFLCRGYDNLGEGQSGILHPTHLLLYYFLPAPLAICLEVFLVFPFAFAGMFFLLKKSAALKNESAVIFGAGLFAFNTFFIAHLPHVNMIWVYAHLPWIMFFLERIFKSELTGRYGGFLALTIASVLLLGHPQMAWIEALIIVMSLTFLTVTQTITWDRRIVRTLMLAIVSGMLIGLLQLLPTIDYFAHSSRRQLTLIERENFSLHPLNLAINFSPYFFIDKSVGDWFYKADMSFEFLNSHQEYPSYIGISTLCIILAGLIMNNRESSLNNRRRSRRFFVGIWLGVFLLLAFGKYGGLYGLFQYLPYVSQFRCPVRYMAGFLFGIAVISAWSIDSLAFRLNQRPLTWPEKLIVALPLCGSLLLLIYGSQVGHLPFLNTKLFIGTIDQLAIGPILSLSAWLLIVRGASGKKYALPCLCVLGWFDVALYATPILYRMEWRSLASVKSAYERMQSEDHLFRHVSKLNQPNWEGAYLANGYLGIAPKDNWELFDNKQHLQLASVRYAHGTTHLFTVTEALPRVRLVSELKHSKNPLAELASINLNRTALCYPDVAPEFTEPQLSAIETVKLTYDGGDKVVIHLNVQHHRLLVLSDRWSPWWQAKIDGKPTPIIPLFDRSVRGLMVSPGDQEIVMTYRPQPLYWGILSATLGAIILIYLLRADKFKQKVTKEMKND